MTIQKQGVRSDETSITLNTEIDTEQIDPALRMKIMDQISKSSQNQIQKRFLTQLNDPMSFSMSHTHLNFCSSSRNSVTYIKNYKTAKSQLRKKKFDNFGRENDQRYVLKHPKQISDEEIVNSVFGEFKKKVAKKNQDDPKNYISGLQNSVIEAHDSETFKNTKNEFMKRKIQQEISNRIFLEKSMNAQERCKTVMQSPNQSNIFKTIDQGDQRPKSQNQYRSINPGKKATMEIS